MSSTSAPRSENAAIIDSSGLRKPDVVDDDEDEDEDAREDKDEDDNKHSVTDTAALAGALAEKAVAGVLAERRELDRAIIRTYAALYGNGHH